MVQMKDQGSGKPNLFLVGAAKAGTTSIAEYLAKHPKIFLCPIKEPNHFNREVDLGSIRKDHLKNTWVDWKQYFTQSPLEKKHIAFVKEDCDYFELFRESAGEDYLLDASTGYLFSPIAAYEINKFNSDAKIIIMLRDPIERTISHFMMDAARGNVSLAKSLDIIKQDYEQANKGYCVSNLYIDLSLYYEQLTRYLDVFTRDNILILWHDELRNNSGSALQRLTEFLGISEFRFADEPQEVHNKTKFSPLRQMKQMRRVKQYIPNALVGWLKKVDNRLAKSPDLEKLQSGTHEYIQKQVMDDWEKTKQLLGTLQ